MRGLIVLALAGGAAYAGPLPHEYQDTGACKALAYDGTSVVRTHEYQRDRAQRLERERTSLASGSTFVRSFAYDRAGRLVSTSADGDHTDFEYDARSRLIKTTTYDRPSSKTVTWIWTYRYDADGRQLQTTGWSRAANAVTIDKQFTYDKGRLAKITLADGTIETRTYDDRGLLVATDEVLGTRHKAFTYKYDARRRLVEQASGTQRIVYQYDCSTPAVKQPAPPEPSNNVRDKPGYCGRPNCGKPRGDPKR